MSPRWWVIVVVAWVGAVLAPWPWSPDGYLTAVGWSVLPMLPALLCGLGLPRLKWWLSPEGMVGLCSLVLIPLPLVLPLAAGLSQRSWAVGFLTAWMTIPPGLALWFLLLRFLEAPNEAGWIEHRLAKTSRSFASLSVGIVRQDALVFSKACGTADRAGVRLATPETLYRIGSVTKVMTTTLLAMLRDRGVVRLDDPVAMYLPPDVTLPTDPRGAPTITLRHLATHASGLPRLPVNLTPKGDDPYGAYTVEALYAGLAATRLDYPTGAGESYSNLGMGLLGHALERAGGEGYEALLRKHIFEPLGMGHTTITLDASQREKLAAGYRADDLKAPAPDWDLGCLAGAGAVVSSVVDLARFVSLQLRAGEAEPSMIPNGTLLELHTPQRLYKDWTGAVGLGWQITRNEALGDPVWHNGGMDGFHSYLAFSPRFQVGVIVLTNCGRSVDEVGGWLLGEAVKTFGVERPKEIDPGLRGVAEAMAGCIVESPPDSLAGLFDESFLSAIPLEQVRPIFAEMYRKHGACAGVEIEPGEHARRAVVVFRFAEGRSRRCEVEVTGGATPKVVYAYFT